MADTRYSVESGFFDSINRDRLYSADDMNMPYKEILTEGIFENDGGFEVTPGTGMHVEVAAGFALLGGKWISSAAKTLTVPANTSLYSRKDSIILQVDRSEAVRSGYLIYRTGTPAATPAAPAIFNGDWINELRIADIVVVSEATSISSVSITDQRGTEEGPYASLNVGAEQLSETLMSLISEHPELITAVPDGGITTAKLASGAVTTDKLGNVIDSSLSLAGKAADAKATGDAITDANEALSYTNDVTGVGFVTASDFQQGKIVWYEDGSVHYTAGSASELIDIEGISQLAYSRMVVTNPTTKGGIAFYDENRTYISGVQNGVGTAENTIAHTVDVPTGAKYVRFSYWQTPIAPFFACDATKYNVSYNKYIRDLREQSRQQVALNTYNTGIRYGYTKDTEPSWTNAMCIRTDGNLNIGLLITADNTLKASDFIPVNGKNSLLITMPRTSLTTPPIWGLCFYDEDQNPLTRYGTTGLYNRSGDNYVSEIEVFIPEKAAYFRTTYWSDSFITEHGIETAFSYHFTDGDYKDESITHDIPANRGILNAVRRARQLTDIKWTPLVDVPRYCLANGNYSGQSDKHFLDWCKAGKEYQGIPYSGSGRGEFWTYGQIDPNCDAGKWGYYMFFVGLDVEFETFVTAARYPNSIFGERANRETYDYDASIYGSVCTALLSYALGLHSPIWPVNTFMTGQNYGKNYFWRIETVSNVDLNVIRIGDALHNSGHVALITDIIRNKDGEVIRIEVSEATTAGNPSNGAPIGDPLGGMCRRKCWPIADFRRWFQTYTIYRFKSFTDLSYTPSKYVNTGKELNCRPPVDLPLIPYLGNRAKYKVGYILNTKILIGASGYTQLVVLKDNETFNTFPLNDANEIEVGFSTAGSYEAYLIDSNSERSCSCYWTVE